MIDTKELRSMVNGAQFESFANSVINSLLDRIEAAEKERDVLRDRLALESQENGALRDSVDRACEERDALRSLVVMRFDHDCPPQFTQGYEMDEFNEPVTAEHCQWFVAEIERLRADYSTLQAKIEEMEKQEPVAWTTEQALRHGASALGFDACVTNLWSEKGVPLYALPGVQGEEK